jgi:hypothetical protein
MKLTAFTIKHLAKMIAGDTAGWPYRSGPDSSDFLMSADFVTYEHGFPTRYMFAEKKLIELNSKDIFKDVFKDMLDGRNVSVLPPQSLAAYRFN